MANQKFIEYVEGRLKKWGYWASRVLTPALGYPPKSIEGRLAEGGGILSASTNKAGIPIDLEADEIDKIVEELFLNEDTIHLGYALRLQYIIISPLSQKAKLSNVSPAQFRSNVLMARWWVGGRITSDREVREHFYAS